jgi:hypothetical protein
MNSGNMSGSLQQAVEIGATDRPTKHGLDGERAESATTDRAQVDKGAEYAVGGEDLDDDGDDVGIKAGSDVHSAKGKSSPGGGTTTAASDDYGEEGGSKKKSAAKPLLTEEEEEDDSGEVDDYEEGSEEGEEGDGDYEGGDEEPASELATGGSMAEKELALAARKKARAEARLHPELAENIDELWLNVHDLRHNREWWAENPRLQHDAGTKAALKELGRCTTVACASEKAGALVGRTRFNFPHFFLIGECAPPLALRPGRQTPWVAGVGVV